MSALLGRLPAWAFGAVLLLVLSTAGMLYQRAAGDAQGRAAVQALWETDKASRAAADLKAVAQRATENLVQARQQAAKSAAIKKAYDEEIHDVLARLAAAERMRKPAFCASAGPAAPAGAGGAKGSTANRSRRRATS